jgi:hypothetical protein
MTIYARIVNGAVVSVSGLPGSAQRLDTGQWVSGFDAADQATREACGYLPVTEVRPALGADQVHGDPAYTINAHDVTATYPVVADQATNINYRRLRTQLAAQIAAGSPARYAVAGNTTFINGAKPGTAAAQASAAYDQAKALSQQNNVLIPTLIRALRVLLDAYDDDK